MHAAPDDDGSVDTTSCVTIGASSMTLSTAVGLVPVGASTVTETPIL